MKKLVIDRATWLRGEGHSRSYLLRSADGMMCCLGFYCTQIAGLNLDQIMDLSLPSSVVKGVVGLTYASPRPGGPGNYYTDFPGVYDLTTANDDKDITERERESRIKLAFAEHFQVDAQFTGRSPRRKKA